MFEISNPPGGNVDEAGPSPWYKRGSGLQAIEGGGGGGPPPPGKRVMAAVVALVRVGGVVILQLLLLLLLLPCKMAGTT